MFEEKIQGKTFSFWLIFPSTFFKEAQECRDLLETSRAFLLNFEGHFLFFPPPFFLPRIDH